MIVTTAIVFVCGCILTTIRDSLEPFVLDKGFREGSKKKPKDIKSFGFFIHKFFALQKLLLCDIIKTKYIPNVMPSACVRWKGERRYESAFE